MADNVSLTDAVALLRELKRNHANANKAQIEAAFSQRTNLRKERSVYAGNGYAIRFSEANTGSFSNVVLSLSALQKYDANPMVICIVRPDRLDFRLANATFLNRISQVPITFGRTISGAASWATTSWSSTKGYRIGQTILPSL